MKYLISLLIAISVNCVNVQSQTLKAFISSEFDKSNVVSVFDNDSNLVMNFSRINNRNSIVCGRDSFLVIKRKLLLDKNNDTLAVFHKDKIYIYNNFTYIGVHKLKKGWSYSMGGKEILRINYLYNKERKLYELTFNYSVLDTITLNVLQLSIARFDKQVAMEYKDDNVINTIVLVVVLLNTL